MDKKTIEYYRGVYILKRSPSRALASHNQISWKKIENYLNSKVKADFDVLSVLVEDHQHGTKSAKHGYQFVTYCIKNGWLERLST